MTMRMGRAGKSWACVAIGMTNSHAPAIAPIERTLIDCLPLHLCCEEDAGIVRVQQACSVNAIARGSVMPGLVPGIDVPFESAVRKTRMAGSSAAMTRGRRWASPQCANLEHLAVVTSFAGDAELAAGGGFGHDWHHGDDRLAPGVLQR